MNTLTALSDSTYSSSYGAFVSSVRFKECWNWASSFMLFGVDGYSAIDVTSQRSSSELFKSFCMIDFLLLASSDRKPKQFLQRRIRENPTRFRSETAKGKRSNVATVVLELVIVVYFQSIFKFSSFHYNLLELR